MADKVPTLLPPEKKETRIARNVFLWAKFWDELSTAAEFQTDAWHEIDPKNPSVSRNDLIEGFLDWALDVYWESKGGKPKDKAEWKAKAKAEAERLKELRAKGVKK